MQELEIEEVVAEVARADEESGRKPEPKPGDPEQDPFEQRARETTRREERRRHRLDAW